MIDLRSDTVTKPTREMYEAMVSVPVGDDVFGDDPTVKRLEETCAERLGKEAGLFVPSGTMANLVCIMGHCQPGDEVYLSEGAHTYEFESGALSAVAGVLPRIVKSEHGAIDPDALEAAIRPANVHFARPRLLCLENTHNTAGGVAIPLEHQKKVCVIAQDHGLAVHLDGARIWNAAIALGVSAVDLAADADSVSFCFSKGLSAPIGSIVLGNAEFIQRARKTRKMLGGGMRQVGVLAAAALVALDTMIDRLAEDHRRAASLASGLEGTKGVILIRPGIQTNMVFLDISGTGMIAQQFADQCRSRGLQVSTPGRYRVRLVTNRHIDDGAVEQAVKIVREVVDSA
ncbi:MAG: low-specificity L-threonine aldolase [bacterium]